MRVVETTPFELSESGWAEFEIAISIFFHSDVCDKQLDLFRMLKLYPKDEGGPQTTKKPVVVETYDEIVFSEPSEAFFLQVQNHPAAIVPMIPASLNLPHPGPVEHVSEMKRGDTKDNPLSQWFMNFSEADELLKLAAAHQQLDNIVGKQCILYGWARRLIAHGLIQSADPNLVVHGKAAGSGNLKIALTEVVDPTCQLWLSDGFHDSIGEVGVGGFVVWPEHSVEVMNG